MPIITLGSIAVYKGAQATFEALEARSRLLEARGDLDRLAEQITEARRLLPGVYEISFTESGEHFWQLQFDDFFSKAYGGPDLAGNVWDDLLPKTKKAKQKRFAQGKPYRGASKPTQSPDAIGIDSGNLSGSIPAFGKGTGDENEIFNVSAESLEVGYGDWYAVIFDEKRTLIPDPLPSAYTDPMDQIFTGNVDQLFDELLGEFA